MRIYLAHRAIPGSSYATLISSTLVLTIVDFSFACGLFVWALTQGVLPGFGVLPSLPSFDFRWLAQHDVVLQIVIVVLVLGLIALAVWIRSGWQDFKARVAQAFTVLRTPVRYLRTVAAWQLCDWALRLATIWFVLGAFDIHQSVRNVLLVQASRAWPRSCRSAPAASAPSRPFSSTSSAVRPRARHCSRSASA